MPIPTQEVLNQPPPLGSYNLFETDRALREAVRREGASWAEAELSAFGGQMGTSLLASWAVQANRHPPVLQTHDRFGHRRDEVEYHPAWHDLMRASIAAGLHSRPWSEPREGAHVARAAHFYLASENECGHLCPVSMTYAAVPVLRRQADLFSEWGPRMLARTYDERFLPASRKSGVLVGMAMTERQGGSDVRANKSRALPISGDPGRGYLLTGHKWFCSAPMCDAFLVLAQAPRGLSCFLLPRFTPDDKPNRFFLMRCKEKLGNRSNASAEVEFDGAWAYLVGEEGRGVATIIEMVSHTRLDCVLIGAGLMRRALSEALHHAVHREAFGKTLIEQPLMRNVLADLAVESEAATVMAMRLARAFDGRAGSKTEAPFGRLALPVAKYWVCKRASSHVGEALECLGGAGYVEESIMPRLFREAPLYSIWEGSGNVNCLDVLRAIRKDPATLDVFIGEITLAHGGDRRLDSCLESLIREMTDEEDRESRARRIVERMALALQGSLLVRHAPGPVADAFCASRLGADGGYTFGGLPRGLDLKAIIERARP
jgi:putative acyl-CoA dehydrogenase